VLFVESERSLRSRGLTWDGSSSSCAGPAENVRVKLSGIEEDDIMAGFVLSSVGNLQPVSSFSPDTVGVN
jgi:peptide chain release factor subunit 3